MDKPLHILHLEDDPDFVELVSAMLLREGVAIDICSVPDYPDFVSALDSGAYDLILADYLLPSCNGIQALEAARLKCPDTPFLLISGTIGEQAAIESLRCGATDYVLKNGLERLVPAVRRAVLEARERSQRRRAEQELVRREKYFRTLTENSLDILTILSREGVFQYNSPSVKMVLGYEPAELAGRNAFEFVHPDDVSNATEAMSQGMSAPENTVTHEFRFRHANGSWRYLEAVGQNRLDDPDIEGIVLNSRDVSDRKRAEAEVLESEKQYRLMFEGNPIPMWISDPDTSAILEVNDAAIRHYGYTRAEFLKLAPDEIRPPEETERFARWLSAQPAPSTPPGIDNAGLSRHRKKGGSSIDVEITWSLVAFKGRQSVLTMANDVTERRRNEQRERELYEKLKQSEASLTAAQRIANLGSWELDLQNLEDPDSNDLRWSDETYRIFGFEPVGAPISNDVFFNCVHPDDRDRIRDAVREALRAREPYDIEHRIIRPNGEERIVRERAELALDEAGNPVQMRGIVLDITERKRLEEQLRQSQKMEALGQLAGGVAHDFNNILTVIHGYASLLREEQKPSSPAEESATQITKAVDRAAGLTRQLLAFSRRQVMQPRRLDINQVVNDMTMMLGRILGEDITLQLNYSPNPAFVHADPSMIEQVLMNLAVNARDALPQGGQLSIRIALVRVTATHLAFHPEARLGEYVCLSVADTGCGIAPENLKRIFEPFFTTKEGGKGTGLGLATVYGIVKQHQGWIEVNSMVGKGATFRVYLPLCTEPTAASVDKPKVQKIRGGDETILVVEDELPVRELVCRVLQGRGYRILQAESGNKAVEIWQETGGKVDLLLTDLVMPDRMNGRELAERLQHERPGLKVMYTSGYSADVVGKQFILQQGLHYLQKPYDPQKLAQAVRQCLDDVPQS